MVVKYDVHTFNFTIKWKTGNQNDCFKWLEKKSGKEENDTIGVVVFQTQNSRCISSQTDFVQHI